MFRRLRPLAALLCLLPHAALADAPEDSLCVRDIERVEITGTRPMKEIGVQRTKLDSIVLRDNISSSLADALTSGSTIFIKSYGRATLATASFRGTSPSHTQVTWNGMKINSPLFGQVDSGPARWASPAADWAAPSHWPRVRSTTRGSACATSRASAPSPPSTSFSS